MTETMRRLGRVYADRVDLAQRRSMSVGYFMRHPSASTVKASFVRARECATPGLEALALRSVLRGMAEARARCGFCGEAGGVDRGSLCPGCRRGLERTNYD